MIGGRCAARRLIALGLLALLVFLWAAPEAAGKRRRKRRRARVQAQVPPEPSGELLAPVAWLYLQNRRYDEAVRLFSELIAAQPAARELHEGRIAACLRSAACAPQRVPWLTEALQRFPGDAEFLAALREERLRLGQTDLAEVEVRAQVARRPDDVEARILLLDALEERGQLYERARHLRELRRALLAALRQRPRDPDLWVRYGRYCLEIDDLTGAADATRRALDLAADHHPPARELEALVRQARAERQAAFEREVDRKDLAQDLGWARAD